MTRWNPVRPIPTIACALLLGSCASSDEEVARSLDEPSPMQRRHRILLGVEAVIHQALQDARRDGIRMGDEFAAAVAAAPRAFRLNTTVPELVAFGESEQVARRDAIEQARSVAVAKLGLLLEQYEAALWSAAVHAGQLERGSDLGTRSGYQELDDKVEAGTLQLERAIDIDSIDQTATLKTYDDIALEREVRHELEGIGVVSLFKSPPTLGLFAPKQEGQAVVATFTRDGLPPEVPLSFVQAERGRVERGSMVLAVTPWQLDPGASGRAGVLPLRAAIDARRCLATEICIPSIDLHAASLRAERDRIVVREYRTALRRDDTGQLVATIGWQVRWNVDFRGTMRVLTDVDDVVLEDDSVLPSLLLAAAPQQ
jgi:hypothetical protein